MEKEDFLLSQIDEFREKAKQLQDLLAAKENKVQELQSIVNEREGKAEEWQHILVERQEEADKIVTLGISQCPEGRQSTRRRSMIWQTV